MHNLPSADFTRLSAAQRQVNAFFWSSEIAYELVRQQVLTPGLRQDSRRVDAIFGEINCNAFKPGTKARRAIAAGRSPTFSAKYNADVAQFERDLRNNLEQICRHVIVRFYSAVERFLVDRAAPSLRLADLPGDLRKKRRQRFLATPFDLTERYLRGQGVTLHGALLPDVALMAQASRMLRNHVIHKEQDWQSPWTDTDFRKMIASSFGAEHRALVLRRLCDNAQRQADKQPEVPILFFYALFSLTDLRRFAEAMEAALP